MQDNVPAPTQQFHTKAEYTKQITELQQKLNEANEKNKQLEAELQQVQIKKIQNRLRSQVTRRKVETNKIGRPGTNIYATVSFKFRN